MNNNAVVPAVPKYYAALDDIAEKLSADGENSEDREDAKKQLLLYSLPQITAYLDAAFPAEEVKRREIKRRRYISFLAMLGYMPAWLFLYDVLYVVHKKLPAVLVLPFALFNFFFMQSNFKRRRFHGQAMMLAEFGETKQVPLLIDTLHIKENRTIIKHKLSTLLPMYIQSDEPPLSDDRKKQLTRHLKESFQEVVKHRDKTVIDINVSFVAAVLIYFERELAQGRTAPKNVMPMLERFAASSPSTHIPESQWAMLKSSAEECLAYVGARK